MTHLQPDMKMPAQDMVPRGLVRAMFILMITALALVAYARLSGRELVGVLPDSPIVKQATYQMVGNREGTVTLYDADGNVVAFSDEDKNGLIGVMSIVLSRHRKVEGVPPGGPIIVGRRENGHITIIDPSTGWSTDLIGYGADNVAAFARLID